MAVARHGQGPGAVAAALASQVHPVFMLPPLASSLFGAVLAGEFAVIPGTVHVLAIFAAVYTAHVKDGFVDFHRRAEDDDHPLTASGCRTALATSTALFGVALGALWVVANPLAVALTIPTWIVAYNHAPTLDLHPVGATAGYPAGIGLSLLGGFAVQAGTLGTAPAGFAAVFFVLLCGVKVIDDAQDFDYDRSIDKRTVAVVVGPARARRVAFGLMVLALALVVGLAVAGVTPPSAAVAVVPFTAVALYARRATSELATMLLVRGAYLFLAVLVAAVWLEPLG